MLRRATPDEAKYLIKLATGDMRTGVKQSLVEEAIAEAYSATTAAPAALVSQVRRADMLPGLLPEVVSLAAAGRLDEARMKLFHPIGFMLANPVQTVEEAVARFTEEVRAEKACVSEALPPEERARGDKRELASEPSTVLRAAQLEDKFDGIRAQLHVLPGTDGQGSRVALYSRNREDLILVSGPGRRLRGHWRSGDSRREDSLRGTRRQGGRWPSSRCSSAWAASGSRRRCCGTSRRC